jgi:hypothetical protein
LAAPVAAATARKRKNPDHHRDGSDGASPSEPRHSGRYEGNPVGFNRRKRIQHSRVRIRLVSVVVGSPMTILLISRVGISRSVSLDG